MIADNLNARVAHLENVLSKINSRLDQSLELPLYLSIPQAAKQLSVCQQTIRRAIKNGKLRAYNVTTGETKATWRIDQQDLLRFVQAAGSHVSPTSYKSKFLGI